MPFQLRAGPIWIAHRGASHKAPENTMAALKLARELGSQWVEFDVMLSKDGEPILIHDETLERTTNGRGAVADYLYDELKCLSAAYRFQDYYPDASIPHLHEAISFLKHHQMNAVIEIKPYPGFERETAAATLTLLEQQWPEFRNYIILSSFAQDALLTIRSLDKEVAIGVSTEYFSTTTLNRVREVNAMSIHIDYLNVDEAICTAIQMEQLAIFCYTVNDKVYADALLKWGVKAIFSDIADELAAQTEVQGGLL